MCTVLLPPGGYPIAVNKYIIYIIFFTIYFKRNSDEMQRNWVDSHAFFFPPKVDENVNVNLLLGAYYFVILLLQSYDFASVPQICISSHK
jgi:hypothetical protein